MVEIGVYSTVGTSVRIAETPRNVGVKCGKERWKSAATAEERAKNGVKDVVKRVALCAL